MTLVTVRRVAPFCCVTSLFFRPRRRLHSNALFLTLHTSTQEYLPFGLCSTQTVPKDRTNPFFLQYACWRYQNNSNTHCRLSPSCRPSLFSLIGDPSLPHSSAQSLPSAPQTTKVSPREIVSSPLQLFRLLFPQVEIPPTSLRKPLTKAMTMRSSDTLLDTSDF